MKNFLKFKSINTAFVILFILPAITIGYYMVTTLMRPIKTVSKMKEVQKLADLAVKSSNLVHELQKERGRSSGYFNSKGKKFEAELRAQRQLTEQKLFDFNEFLDGFDQNAYGNRISKNLTKIKSDLSHLEDNRSNIDKFQSSASKVLGYYTDIISNMLDNVEAIANLAVEDQILFKTLKAYKNLLEYKERNGIMRAVYSGVFGKNKFTDFLYRKAIALDAEANVYLNHFNKYATDEQKAFFLKTVKGQDVEAVKEMKEYALKNYKSDSLGIDAGKWFNAITNKINLLKKVEDNLAQQILDRSHYLNSQAYTTVIVNVVAVIIIISLIIIIALSIIKRINNIVRISQKTEEYQKEEAEKLSKGLEKLANGDLDFQLEASKTDDELKEVAAVFTTITQAVNQTVSNIKYLIGNINELTMAVNRGDLAYRINCEKCSGEYKTITIGMNKLIDTFAQVMEKIIVSANSIADYADEISDNTENIATSAEELNQQTDEVAYAIGEMSKTIDENAMSTTKTANVANENQKVARDGVEVVEITINKMKEIAKVVEQSAQNIGKLGDSSTKIGEIIGVIEEIADQTNLLALNAAIEAARAGEQGRGFAVVADEVRKLAERTTEATQQISQMIKGIQKETMEAVTTMNQGTTEVQNGIELADKASESLDHIVSSSKELLDMIAQIATASEEQSSTSKVISQNVFSISEVTTDTVKKISEIAAAIGETSAQANELKELLSQFKLNNPSQDNFQNNVNLLASEQTKQLPE